MHIYNVFVTMPCLVVRAAGAAGERSAVGQGESAQCREPELRPDEGESTATENPGDSEGELGETGTQKLHSILKVTAMFVCFLCFC